MPLTDYANQKITATLFGNVYYSVPEVLYIALSTKTPTQNKGDVPFWDFVEPEGYDYHRVAIPNDLINWAPANTQPLAGYTIQNNTIISFPKAIGPWGVINSFGIFDSPNEGNLLGFGLLTEPETQTITNGDIASFPVGFFTITIL